MIAFFRLLVLCLSDTNLETNKSYLIVSLRFQTVILVLAAYGSRSQVRLPFAIVIIVNYLASSIKS